MKTLREQMEAAAAAMDFEAASHLRDQISLLAGSPHEPDAAPDTARLKRQAPGAMGLGTSDQVMTPPPGWRPPPKPDPMTKGGSRPRRGRR